MLLAAAIILIPEMLSGPDSDARGEATTARNGETPLKTYTIDLTKSPATQAAERAIDNRAPPAEVPVTTPEPAPATQTNPESTQVTAEPSVADDAPKGVVSGPAAPAVASQLTESPPVQVAARQPAPDVAVAPRIPAPAPAPASGSLASVAPAAAGTNGAGWAVQLGSFASRVTAERMVKTLQADGHVAFVMPVKSGQATLYRVRIGPMKDRESAAQALRKVKAAAPGATVVAHP